MYEFFPAAHINEKKFILEVIYHFSPSMLILKLDENEQSRSRIDRREETTTSLDNSALKSNSRQPVNGERSVPNSISNHKSSSLSLNEKWRLSVDSSSTYTTKPLNVNVSSQDRRVCSSFDYDAMLVNPEFSNVRTDHQKFTPQDLLLLTNKRPTTSDSPANEAKSPFSIMSFDDKFDFSSGERSESNSTQPTSSGSNSMSSPFIIKTMKTDHPKSLLNAPVPVKGIFLNSTLIDGKTDDGFQLKKKLATKTKQQQLDTVIEEIEKVSTTANNSSDATNNHTSKRSSVKDDLKLSKFTTYHPNNPILISNIVPTQVSNFDSKEGLIERTITFPEEPQVSQWLDGNEKLYSLTRNDTDANISIPANIIQSNTSSQYSTPAGSIKSIPSEEYVAEPIPTSSKKHGKQPAQKFQAHYQHRRSNSTEYDDWTPSSSPSPTTTTTTMRVAKSSSPSTLTEAETFKREVQQTYNTKDNAYSAIYKNIFLSTPTSNTTSQIQYYDDEDENDMYRCQGVSSQLRSFTMTPRSRYSQQTRSSSANLTAEEYMLRKKSRETSFMMLVPQETKQELLLRAVKQSTLSHWLQTFSANAKKLNQNMKVDSTSTAQTASIVSNDIDTSSSAVEIRLQHYSSKNRTIKKKKGFYHQKGSNRRQKGIIL
jgi:hypothetical protein